MADTGTPTRRRRTLIWWVAALAALIGVALAAEKYTGQQSRCDQADEAVEDVLRALAMWGEDDDDLLDLYRARTAEQQEACT